jgi:hypothetical protein
MSLYPVGERFFQEFTLRQVLLNATKNRSGLSAAGTSSQAEGPNTAEDVETTLRGLMVREHGRCIRSLAGSDGWPLKVTVTFTLRGGELTKQSGLNA